MPTTLTIPHDTAARRAGLTVRAAAGGELEILLYGLIGDPYVDGTGISARSVAEALKANKAAEAVAVRINSPGGDAIDAAAMYNALRRHAGRVTVDIDGGALSAASLVAMAGHVIRIADNAMMMVHKPWALAIGDGPEIRQVAERLDKIGQSMARTYAARSGAAEATVREWMAAETWFTAAEAVAAGLADEVTGAAARIAALPRRFAMLAYRNAPAGWPGSGGEPAAGEGQDDRPGLTEFQAAFPNDTALALKAVVNGWTIEQARAFQAQKARRAAAASLAAKAAKAKPAPKPAAADRRYAARLQSLLESGQTEADAHKRAANQMPDEHAAWARAGCPMHEPAGALAYVKRVKALTTAGKTEAQAHRLAANQLPAAHAAWRAAGCPW